MVPHADLAASPASAIHLPPAESQSLSRIRFRSREPRLSALRAALRRAMRGECSRASETLLRRDSLSDFNDGCKDFAELRALIVQGRATAMNDGDPGPARRPNFDIVRDELVMA